MAIVTGNLIKGNSASPVGATDSGIAVGDPSATPTVTGSLHAVGYVADNNNDEASSGKGGYWIETIGGVPTLVLTMNAANNLDIDPGKVLTFIGFGCSLIMRTGKEYLIESVDLVEDTHAMSSDLFDNLRIGYSDSFASYRRGDVNIRTLPTQGVNIVSGSTRMAQYVPGGRLQVRPGTALGFDFAGVGGRIGHFIADVSSTSTNGTKDTLYSLTIRGSMLAANGDSIDFYFTVATAAHATATRQIGIKFGGTEFFDSTAQVTSAASTGTFRGRLFRVSSTSVGYSLTPVMPGMATAPKPISGAITGLTLANDNDLVLTGAAAATGAASGDITAKDGAIDWAPAANMPTTPIVYRPELYWEADAGVYTARGQTLATTNNQTVAQILDRSGYSRHPVLPRTQHPPLYKTAAVNGLPAILFDGVDDYLYVPDIVLTQPYCVYIVFKQISTINNARLISGGVGAGELFLGAGGDTLYMYSGDLLGGLTPGKTNYNLVRAYFNGASSEISLNGGSKTTGNAGTTTPNALSIGATADNTTPTNNANVSIAAMVIVPGNLGESAITTALMTKYGL